MKTKDGANDSTAGMRMVLLRFGAAGVWNTCFSYAVYALCIYLGAAYPLAILASNIAAVVNNYFSFRFFVFGDRPKAAVSRYLAGFAANYCFALAVLAFFVEVAGIDNKYAAAIVALPFMVAASFAINNWYVFRAKGNY